MKLANAQVKIAARARARIMMLQTTFLSFITPARPLLAHVSCTVGP